MLKLMVSETLIGTSDGLATLGQLFDEEKRLTKIQYEESKCMNIENGSPAYGLQYSITLTALNCYSGLELFPRLNYV